jgi:hypothetical protein
MNLHFTCKFIQNALTPTLGAATLDQRLAERTQFFFFILHNILGSCLVLLFFPSNDEGWEPGSTGGMERAAPAALGDVAPLAARGSGRWRRGRAGPGRTPPARAAYAPSVVRFMAPSGRAEAEGWACGLVLFHGLAGARASRTCRLSPSGMGWASTDKENADRGRHRVTCSSFYPTSSSLRRAQLESDGGEIRVLQGNTYT